ncbi:MAG: hypothetical protein NVV72_12025 [Asticcacaulis sp.]|nr:hypothetical protein [Asticcacaulis sp.]
MAALMYFAGFGTACAQTPAQTAPEGRPMATSIKKDALAYADGRSFKTLDDYLAFRKTLGTTGRSFYEEISPGNYRLVTGRRLPGAEEKIYTREELLKKFGFSE